MADLEFVQERSPLVEAAEQVVAKYPTLTIGEALACVGITFPHGEVLIDNARAAQMAAKRTELTGERQEDKRETPVDEKQAIADTGEA